MEYKVHAVKSLEEDIVDQTPCAGKMKKKKFKAFDFVFEVT